MFQEIAVESAHSYLNYLKEEQKGVSEIAVTEIHQDIKNPELFSMTLYKHPYVDSMQIRINGHICKQNEIRPVKYNKKTRILIVRAISTFVDIMRTAEEKDVFISSDLTFLVERVENWYKQFGMMVQLPRTKQNVSYIQRESSKNPSPDQLAAIQGILKHPFTYIWGAPGTGKTQVVLSDAIISYIFANKKVLITAPTNNALEQTLYGLLPIMKEAGFDYDKLVIRLGTPSSDFAEKYPGVCENTAEAQRLSELNDRITLLNNRIIELEQLLSLFPKYRDYLVAMESLQRYTEEAPRIIEDLQRLNHLHEYHENEITRLEGRIALDTEDLDTLQKKMHRHTARIKLLTENIQKYDTALSKKLHAKRIREYSNELASLLTDEETVKKELEDKKDTVNENRQEIISHKRR